MLYLLYVCSQGYTICECVLSHIYNNVTIYCIYSMFVRRDTQYVNAYYRMPRLDGASAYGISSLPPPQSQSQSQSHPPIPPPTYVSAHPTNTNTSNSNSNSNNKQHSPAIIDTSTTVLDDTMSPFHAPVTTPCSTLPGPIVSTTINTKGMQNETVSGVGNSAVDIDAEQNRPIPSQVSVETSVLDPQDTGPAAPTTNIIINKDALDPGPVPGESAMSSVPNNKPDLLEDLFNPGHPMETQAVTTVNVSGANTADVGSNPETTGDPPCYGSSSSSSVVIGSASNYEDDYALALQLSNEEAQTHPISSDRSGCSGGNVNTSMDAHMQGMYGSDELAEMRRLQLQYDQQDRDRTRVERSGESYIGHYSEQVANGASINHTNSVDQDYQLAMQLADQDARDQRSSRQRSNHIQNGNINQHINPNPNPNPNAYSRRKSKQESDCLIS